MAGGAARGEPRPDDTRTGVDDVQAGRLADERGVGGVAGAEDRPHAVAAALLLDHRAEDQVAGAAGNASATASAATR